MTNTIPGETLEYDFGLDFDYAVWTPNTRVDLVNVPWNNDYRDVVKFDNRPALDAYIDSIAPAGLVVTQLSYIKPNEPIRLQIPFNRAIKYNYLRASNPTQPIPDDERRNFYYFILDVRYVAPMTTELVLQLDVFETYIYDVNIGRCYVERGHIGIANEDNFNNYGRDYLTVPEGLDVGGEYQVRMIRNHWIMSSSVWNADNGGPSQPGWNAARYPGYDILVFSTIDLTADPGTVESPNLITASGSSIDRTDQGAEAYVFSALQWKNFLIAWQDKPWVTQGIVSITMIPRVKRYHPGFVYSTDESMGAPANGDPPISIDHSMQNDWRDSIELLSHLSTRYAHLKKFLTFPYTVVEMTTFHGTPVILKPECWNNDDGIIMERSTMVPPNSRVEFTPRFYNSKYNENSDIAEDLWPIEAATPGLDYYDDQKGDDWGEYLDVVTQIANFPTMTIVNNGAIGYLAANTHGITFSRQSADWTQQRALGSNQASYDIQTSQMQTNRDLSEVAKLLNSGMTANQNWLTATQGANNMQAQQWGGAGNGANFGSGYGAVGGGALGILGSIFGGNAAANSITGNEMMLATRNLNVDANTAIGNRQAGMVRDTNSDLAKWAARGDYANAIAGINAKVQDAALIQPTTSGQMAGETINISNGGLQISARWKMIDKASVRVIGEFWLRYGYAIRASIMMPASLKVMSKFTYWKLSETYISSSMVPEGFKQVIRGIFEKGVTVWTTPSDIGYIDWADNTPLPGIRY